MENEEVKHKRRVRYSGTHPKKFEEKYKELNPEKYSKDIEHIISRGATPAGMHISIMVNEILEFLDIRPGQTGLDATLGYGGHTRAMLEKLQGNGHIYALDVDPIESEKTKKRLADLGFGEDINHMIIGSIIPLVPGVPFTNGIRDIADGDYISGAVRLLDAMLVFLCVAIGVGVMFTVYRRLMGGVLL